MNKDGLGLDRHGSALSGKDGQAGHGTAWIGRARSGVGLARQDWHVPVWHGEQWRGVAGKVGLGTDGTGSDWQGRHG